MGEAYAREAASRGLHVVLAARRADELERAAEEIRADFGVETRTARIDLGAQDLLEQVRRATADVEIGLLVYNAASVAVGRFLDRDLAQHLQSIDVNCRGPVTLCFHFGGLMAERGRGGMVVMTSGAAFAGSGYLASYSASKAFDLNLGESLWAELKPRGVDVLALIGGATNTPHTLATGIDFSQLGAPIMEAADVVREAYDHLGEGPNWIPGEHNRKSMEQLAAAPRQLVVEAMTATNRKLYSFED
jgi:short-subunit dehydrogenase